MFDQIVRWLVIFEVWMVIVWVFRHLAITVVFWRTPRLSLKSRRYGESQSGGKAVGGLKAGPLISVLIPCKDEQENVAGCARDILSQSYENIELILVNDRSSDGTGAEIDRIAEMDGRVKAVHVVDRPAGWTGKTYALKRGMEQARGEWLLFVDADTRHERDCVSIVMNWAVERQASMVSLLPQMRCETFWERVNQPLCGIVLMRSYPPELVNADWSRMAFANGQFILIERGVYEAAGGHEAVRDKFVEDIYLAKVVKQKLKKRVLTAVAPEICSTRMYTELVTQIQGWARIYYDAWQRNIWTAVWKIVEPLVFTQTAYVMPVLAVGFIAAGLGDEKAWQLLGLAVVHNVLMFTVIARMYWFNRARWQDAVWYPLSGLISDVIYLRVMRMCLTGKVTWRGTTYTATTGPDGGSIAEPHVGGSVRVSERTGV